MPAWTTTFRLAVSGRLSKYSTASMLAGTATCVPEREPKSTVMEALSETIGPPVPDNSTVCGLPVPPSVKLSKATRDPAAVGLKLTATVQDAPAARLVPQVLLAMEKSPGSVLVKAMLEIETVDEPLLCSVTVC
jgi:hypothetical protein